MTAGEIGFFVNLWWWRDSGDDGMTEGVNTALGRMGRTEGFGCGTSGETGAAGR